MSSIALDQGWWIPTEKRKDPAHPALSQVQEAADQIGQTMAYVPVGRRRVAVQAGGRVGVWPMLLAKYFAHVHTFEPDPVNAMALKLNCLRMGNVTVHQQALGADCRPVSLQLSDKSDGMHHVAAGGPKSKRIEVLQLALDALPFVVADALFLDCEGYELHVLKGAQQLIERSLPVIVLEENIFIERYGRARGDAQRYLESFGYKLVDEFTKLPPYIQNDGKFHGSDLIFAARAI